MPFKSITSSAILALAALGAASTACAQSGDSSAIGPFTVSAHGTLALPFTVVEEPGTQTIFVTEKQGAVKFLRKDGSFGEVTGLPEVDFGGQGGMGDWAFAPDYAQSHAVYLTWVEAGDDDTRGAALGKGRLTCGDTECALEGLEVIWRQNPKVTGRGHFSHKIAFAPDGGHIFLSSGDRQKGDPAQDTTNNLGGVVRLELDGRPAFGNPLQAVAGASTDLWSWGHRNLLGLQFSADGRLWDLEHGPAGGDEINLVEMAHNYGWPVVSGGNNYDGSPIPAHDTHPEYTTPAINWTPVIAPGDFIFYSGEAFPQFKGQALIAALGARGIVRVAIEGDKAVELERIGFDARLRDITQAADGTLWVVEDGPQARLLHLTPKR